MKLRCGGRIGVALMAGFCVNQAAAIEPHRECRKHIGSPEGYADFQCK